MEGQRGVAVAVARTLPWLVWQVVRLPIFALLVIFECVFRLMPATDSAASRPPIPRHAGHPHWEIRHSRVRPG